MLQRGLEHGHAGKHEMEAMILAKMHDPTSQQTHTARQGHPEDWSEEEMRDWLEDVS